MHSWNTSWICLLSELRSWAETGQLACTREWLLELLALFEQLQRGEHINPQLSEIFLHGGVGAASMALGNVSMARRHAELCTRAAQALHKSPLGHVMQAAFGVLNMNAFVHRQLGALEALEEDIVLLEVLGRSFELPKLLALSHRQKLTELRCALAMPPPVPTITPLPPVIDLSASASVDHFSPSSFQPIDLLLDTAAEPDVRFGAEASQQHEALQTLFDPL